MDYFLWSKRNDTWFITTTQNCDLLGLNGGTLSAPFDAVLFADPCEPTHGPRTSANESQKSETSRFQITGDTVDSVPRLLSLENPGV